MHYSQALGILQLDTHVTDSDDVLDAYELQLHPIKQYWLTSAVIPSLFLKRLEKVKELYTALLLLYPEFNSSISLIYPEWRNTDDLVRNYESGLAFFKTSLGKLLSYDEISVWVNSLINFQEAFEERLLQDTINNYGSPGNWSQEISRDLKISDGMNTLLVSAYLKAEGSEKEKLKIEFLSELYKIVRRNQISGKKSDH